MLLEHGGNLGNARRQVGFPGWFQPRKMSQHITQMPAAATRRQRRVHVIIKGDQANGVLLHVHQISQ